MSLRKQKLFSLLALALFAATGCGKDKTLDQYQRDQANSQLAQTQAAAGTYRGVIVNRTTGQPFGALELVLNATQVPISDGSGTGSIGRSILQGRVRIVSGSAQTTAVVTTGGYVPAGDDPNVGNITATVTVTIGTGSSGSTATFALNAHLANGTLSGVLTPTDRAGTAGSFNVTRDAPLPRVGQGSTLPGADATQYFAGTYVKKRCLDPQFRNSIFCRNVNPNQALVTMKVNMNPSSSGIAFVNLFADVKTYYVQLTFNRVVFSLANAEYTPSAGTLMFQGVAQGDTSPVTLSCQAQGAGYSCSFRIEAANDTYSFNLTPSAPGN